MTTDTHIDTCLAPDAYIENRPYDEIQIGDKATYSRTLTA